MLEVLNDLCGTLNGEEPKYDYNFNYQNWYPSVKHETVPESVGLFDFSTFSKFDLKVKTHSDLQKFVQLTLKMKLVNLPIHTC